MTVCVDCCPRPRPPVPSDGVSVIDAMQRSVAMEQLWGISVCSGAVEDKSRETGREWSTMPFKTFYTKKDHVVTTPTGTSEKGTINN